MTLFISNENQEILWNIFNSNKYISNMDIDFKSNWFKQTVSIYYEKYNNVYIKPKDIININKEFILHIKNDLKFINEYNKKKEEEEKLLKQEYEKQNKFLKEQQDKISNENFLKSQTLQPKPDDVNRNFQERQTEYSNLLTPKPPEDVDFAEKDEQDVITDMESLLKKQQEDRENMDKESNSMYEKYISDNDLKKDIEVIEPS
jgi:hypothetical protein